MTSVHEPKNGYLTVSPTQDPIRWRHMLFVKLRTSPLYKGLGAEPPETVARRIGLTSGGIPCRWAVEMIKQDREGVFRPERVPVEVSRAVDRTIELFASLHGFTVDVLGGSGLAGDPLATDTHRPVTAMQIGSDDWKCFEEKAVQAVRYAVQDMRRSFTGDQGPAARYKRIQASKEISRETQIERLAFRLTGRAGTPNDRRTDRRLCDELGIDVPGVGKT